MTADEFGEIRKKTKRKGGKMKRLAWMTAMMVAAVVSAGDVLWRFSPETVDLSSGTTCTKTEKGWILSQPKHRIQCFSKETFEIKPNVKYFVRIKVRGLAPKARIWVVSKNLDAKGRGVTPTSVDCVDDTVTILGTYIHPGTKEIKIEGAAKWPQVKRGTVLVFNAQADGSDLPNHDYYTIRSIAEDGTVTLDRPLRRGYRAETFVRRRFRNGPYHSLIGSVLNTDFEALRRDVSGISEKGISFNHWLRGTVKVRIGIEAENDIEVADCFFSEIAE